MRELSEAYNKANVMCVLAKTVCTQAATRW
jgi:hypothetical protein